MELKESLSGLKESPLGLKMISKKVLRDSKKVLLDSRQFLRDSKEILPRLLFAFFVRLNEKFSKAKYTSLSGFDLLEIYALKTETLICEAVYKSCGGNLFNYM